MGTLTATKIKSISKPGKHGDGDGLYLNVAKGGSKSWIQRVVVDSKRREIGLGGYPAISLAKARELNADNRTSVAEGRNPLVEKRMATRSMPTFKEAALKVHQLNAARFKSQKHSKNWIQMVAKYTVTQDKDNCPHPIGDLPLDKIDGLDVLTILEPIWTTKQETARRVRQRVRAIFAWGMAHGYCETNPAGEPIDAALPSMPKVKEHFRALPYAELPAALETIRSSNAGIAAKLALQFVTLTAARSGEVRGATWAEIDWDKRLWVVPADRMKGAVEHRVPLSGAALDVLREAWELREAGDVLFPSPMKAGSGLSDMTLTKILRSTGLASRMTVHGLRTTFRVFVAEETATPWMVAELALAHRVGTSVEQAYHRTDLIDQRRELMDTWAEYLAAA